MQAVVGLTSSIKGTAWYNTMRKKTTRGLNTAGNFLLMFAQQTSSDLGTLTTDHSTASILTPAQKHTGKKKPHKEII